MTGSLQKKGNKWYVVIGYNDERGKKRLKWIATGKSKKSEAQTALNDVLSQLQNGTYVDAKKTLFADYLLYWLDNVAKRDVEQTTYEGYCTNVKKHIVPYFSLEKVKLTELTALDLQSYFDSKYAEGLSASYLRKHCANIKKALNRAVKLGLINSNPVIYVDLPKKEKYIAKYYSVEQLDTLLEVAKGTSIEPVVILATFYGLRRGEILGLRWQDINFAEGTISICNQRTRVSREIEKMPKSISSIRTLPLIPQVSEYLIELKLQQMEDKKLFGNCYKGDHDYVCRHQDGRPLGVNSINDTFNNLLKKNGLPPIRLHDLRHSAASYLVKHGVSLKEVQVWLGHSDISVTADIYTHVDTEMKQNTARTIEKIFSEV